MNDCERGSVWWSCQGSLLLSAVRGTDVREVAGLVFDLGGTLDADGVSWRERFRTLLSATFPNAESGMLERAIGAGERSLLEYPDAASLGLREMVSVHVKAQLSETGLPQAGQAEVLTERFADETMSVLRRRGRLLHRLAARLSLAVVSNGCGNTRVVLKEAGLADCFCCIVDSMEIGVWKPSSAIFGSALRSLRLPSDRVAAVGDRLDRDVDGAVAAGMMTIWVTPGARERRQELIESARAFGHRVDAVISSVDDLDPGAGG